VEYQINFKHEYNRKNGDNCVERTHTKLNTQQRKKEARAKREE